MNPENQRFESPKLLSDKRMENRAISEIAPIIERRNSLMKHDEEMGIMVGNEQINSLLRYLEKCAISLNSPEYPGFSKADYEKLIEKIEELAKKEGFEIKSKVIVEEKKDVDEGEYKIEKEIDTHMKRIGRILEWTMQPPKGKGMDEAETKQAAKGYIATVLYMLEKDSDGLRALNYPNFTEADYEKLIKELSRAARGFF